MTRIRLAVRGEITAGQRTRLAPGVGGDDGTA